MKNPAGRLDAFEQKELKPRPELAGWRLVHRDRFCWSWLLQTAFPATPSSGLFAAGAAVPGRMQAPNERMASIDSDSGRTLVGETPEGGRAAFALPRQKYGYSCCRNFDWRRVSLACTRQHFRNVEMHMPTGCEIRWTIAWRASGAIHHFRLVGPRSARIERDRQPDHRCLGTRFRFWSWAWVVADRRPG